MEYKSKPIFIKTSQNCFKQIGSLNLYSYKNIELINEYITLNNIINRHNKIKENTILTILNNKKEQEFIYKKSKEFKYINYDKLQYFSFNFLHGALNNFENIYIIYLKRNKQYLEVTQFSNINKNRDNFKTIIGSLLNLYNS